MPPKDLSGLGVLTDGAAEVDGDDDAVIVVGDDEVIVVGDNELAAAGVDVAAGERRDAEISVK